PPPADAPRLRQALAWQMAPSIVVRHSYGGQVMTALGADTANVVGLVYIAGFGLDEGESIAALGGDAPPAPALANLIVDEKTAGCPRTTPSVTLRPTSTPSRRRSCTPLSSRSP